MNLLYISALEGGKYSGPLHSVPRQIDAQSMFDNVYWLNLTIIDTRPFESVKVYHYMPLKQFDMKKLPKPFDNPDLIVFEEFFKIECCLIARKVEKYKIPYIIIPRCQMTKQYIKNKHLKKLIASLLFFNHFAKKSKAVHFLTKQERQDSIEFYKGNAFIEPNGIDLPNEISKPGMNEYKTGVFIGRYSIWQKGLDILISAISENGQLLRKNKIKFVLYGPDERTGTKEAIEKIVINNNVSDLVSVEESVFGDEKRKVLLKADFFLHTSRFEGMPMAVLEALSYGIPCFVTQGSNMREIVEKANAGWGAETNVLDVSQTLKKLVETLPELHEKGENARLVANQFSWKEIAKMCHCNYEELLL